MNTTKSLLYTIVAFFIVFSVSCKQPDHHIQELERLAYVSGGTIHIAGLNDQTHTEAGNGREPSLSADGRYLAYVTNIGTKQRIAIFDFPNRNTKVIDDVQGTAWSPAWSPTENRFLFSAMVQGESNTYRVAIVGHTREESKYVILRPGIDIFSPVWAPDGETVFGHDTQFMYQWEKTGLLINHFNLKEKFGPISFNSSSIILPSADGSHWIIGTVEKQPSGTARKGSLTLYLYNETDQSLRNIKPENAIISEVCWGGDNYTLIFSGKTRRNQRQNDIYELNIRDNKISQLVKNASQPYFRTIKVVQP